MSATLLGPPTETPQMPAFCASCPALQRLEQEVAALRRQLSKLRCEVGYWKSRHADAVRRIDRLKEKLEQAQGQVREL